MRHALDLFSFAGRVTRLQYLAAGVVLFLAKYGVDLGVSRAFKKPWHPLNYLSPRISPFEFGSLLSDRYLLVLLLCAIPFMVVGVSLSARRLRDMGVSPFWSGLFFLPFLKYAFFLLLCVAPSHRPRTAEPEGAGPYREPAEGATPPPPAERLHPDPLLSRLIPKSLPLAFVLGVLSSLLLGGIAFVVTVQLNKTLGAFLFVGMPFGMGFLTALAVTYWHPTSSGAAICYGLATNGIGLLLLLLVGWEGVACLIMAAPLVGALSALGSFVGWHSTRLRRLTVALMGVFLVPGGLLTGEMARQPEPARHQVTSSVTIAASPEVVWKNVVSFPPIDEPPDPIFAIVAMPVEATIQGTGPGARRECIFTTGSFVSSNKFVEPITAWHPGRELTFRVDSQPANLDRYMDVTRGQFLLEKNADGTTTLHGTTWYQLRIFPTAYWNGWAKLFMHAIHLRVLRHIKRISEEPERLAHPAQAAVIPEWQRLISATCKCTMPKAGAGGGGR